LKVIRQSLCLLSKKEQTFVVLLILGMAFSSFLEVIGVGLIIPLVGLFAVDNPDDFHPLLKYVYQFLGYPSTRRMLIISLSALCVVYLAKNSVLALFFWFQTRFIVSVQERISSELFRGYLAQPYVFHLQRNTSELVRNTIGETGQFAYSFLLPALTLVAEAFVVIALIGFLALVEPMGTVVVATSLGAASLLYYTLLKKRLTTWGESRQKHDGRRLLHLQQGLGGIKETKIIGCEPFFSSAYDKSNKKTATVWCKQIFYAQVPRFGIELMAVVILVGLTIALIKSGAAMAEILPTLGLFAAAAFRLMPSINRLIASIQNVRFGIPAMEVLQRECLNHQKEKLVKTEKLGKINRLGRIIEVRNLCFRHDGAEENLFNGLNIEIHAGQSAGIVGPSGIGKTTLVDLLLGLHSPDSGDIFVDGVDISTDLRGWQCQIGYVPQTVFLTDDSLRRNIAFGIPDEDINDEQVWRSLEASQLDNFVRSLSVRLDTLVGEMGVRISGGQRQRIGIARAMYRDPTVLVFDEATSALDGETEAAFIETIQKFRGTKTLIVIAHRLSTIRHCDFIVRMGTKSGVAIENTPA